MQDAATSQLLVAARAMPVKGALPKVVCALLALALLLGFGVELAGLFGFELDGASAATSLACGVASIAFVTALSGRGRKELVAYLAFFGMLVVLCVVLHSALSAGGAKAFNALLLKIGKYTQVYPLSYEEAGQASTALFCGVVSLILGFMCALFTNKGNVALCLVLACLVCLAAAVGLAPASAWFALLAAGVIGTLVMNTMQHESSTSGKTFAGILAVLLVCCAVIAGIVGISTSFGVADTSSFKGAASKLVYALRYGANSYAMPQGQLNDLPALQASDQPALSISTDASTKEYLRGFVGERYEDGSWGALDGQSVMQSEALFHWLGQDGFSSASQLSLAASASGFDGAEAATMTIEYQGARGDYAYLPYSYSSGAVETETTDLAQTRRGDATSVDIEFGAALTSRAYLLLEKLADAQGSATDTKYYDDESAYSEFVHDNYLSIPQEIADCFEGLFGAASQLSSEQAKLQVLDNLSQAVGYSTDYETDNADTDFVVYFLTEEKTGYCVHYATAAALMMRYYGIPARYVEGYLLDTTAEESGDEADTGEDAEGGNAVQLTEENAHAWVEYYLEGVGWIPFEVTPGFEDSPYYESTSDAQLIEEAQSSSVGDSNAEAPWSPQEQTEEQENEGEAETVQFAKLGFDFIWFMFVIGLLLVLLAAFIVRERLLQSRLRRAVALNSSPVTSAKEGTSWLFSYGVLLLEECGGVKLENRPYSQQAETLSGSGLCDAEVFEAAACANDKALFANDACDEADRNAAVAFVGDVRAGLKCKTSVAKRFWQRRVRCLW